MTFRAHRLYPVAAAVGLAFAVQAVGAANKDSLDAKKDSLEMSVPEALQDEAARALEAAEVVKDMMTGEDREIPEDILRHAEAVAVIPDVVKGAFMIGGRHGKGLVAERVGDGWGAPLFVEIGGASFGLQIGVESADLVLVFTKKDGLQSLLEDKVKLGADIAVAAGPIGREGAVATNLSVDSPIYSYSRSKGAFAGVSLEGAVLDLDEDANEEVYGSGIDASQVLSGAKKVKLGVTEPFVRALERHVPAKDSD